MANEDKDKIEKIPGKAMDAGNNEIASLRREVAELRQLLADQRRYGEQPVNANIIVPDKLKVEKDRYDAKVLETDEIEAESEKHLAEGEYFVRVGIIDGQNQAKISTEEKTAKRHLEPWEFAEKPWNPWRIVGVGNDGEAGIWEAIAKYNKHFGITSVFDPTRHVSYRCRKDGSPILDGKTVEYRSGIGRHQLVDVA